MKTVLIILAWLCIAATVVPLIRLDDWWIRFFDFPRLQILGLGLLTCIALLFVWNKTHLMAKSTFGVLVLCLLFQGFKMYPYTPLASKQVLNAQTNAAGARLTLMIANVLMENRQAQQLLNLVRDVDPDVLLAVETNAWWAEQLRPLEDIYPYTVKQPQDNHYGMMLYSRLELINPEIKFLVSDDIPSIHTQVALSSGERFWLHGLHPRPPSPTGADESTQRDAELLIVGREVKQRNEPVIVAGDLNDVAWSYTTTLFQKASGLLDPRIGRGPYNSYNAKNILMRWPLDHVFHSDHFLLHTLRLLPAFGSDHFPVYVALSLSPQAEILQEAPELEADEKEQVEEKINQVEQKEKL